MNRRYWATLAAAFLLSGAVATSATAAITAEFADGNDDTNGGVNPPTVDSFRGTGGDGWTGGWARFTNFSPTFITNVESTSPVNGGGDYLQASLQQASGDFGQATVMRQYENVAGGVQLDQPHHISFDLRTDTALSSSGSINSRFQIFDNSSAGQSATSSTNSWVIAGYSAAGSGPSGIVSGNWGFLSGSTTSNSFTAQTFVDTGIAIEAGTTYHMDVFTDPTTKTWVGTISNGTETFTSGSLNWRNNQVATAAGGYLYWGIQKQASVGGDPYAFSLDNIAITVPEPATVLLAALLAAAHPMRRRWT